MSDLQTSKFSRRAALRAGVGLLGAGAVAAFLSACGGSGTPTTGAATSVPASGGGAGASTAPTAAASTSGAPAASGAPAGSTAAAQGTPVGVSSSKGPKNPNATKIQWWHGMGGANGTAVATLTDQFNDSQTDIYVDAIYQGSYDDIINKFKVSLPAKQLPHMMQVYDIGQRFMIDSQAIEPIQSLIDADKFDTSQFEAAILKYYTTDSKLYAMPFNSSNPILYYNKKMFSDAGLDPNTPPRTWDDVQTMAAKITKKDANQYGISIPIYAWLFEQWHAAQNALLVDPDNGRGSARATKVLYNGASGQNILTWWKGLLDNGAATNLGRNTSDTQKAFTGGQIAMTLDSTASLRGIVAGAGDKFEVGTGYLPRQAATADQGGVIIGGASNYILKDKSDKEKQAAWKFIQWLSQPMQQAFWHVNTGYFPIRKDVYDLQLEVDNAKKYPQFSTAVNQLHDSKLTPATNGAVLGVFTPVRTTVETAIEEFILGKSTAQAALDKSASSANQLIDQYNAAVK